MCFQETHFLIRRLLFASIRIFTVALGTFLEFNGFGLHLRLELELVRVQEAEGELLTECHFFFKLSFQMVDLLDDFACLLLRDQVNAIQVLILIHWWPILKNDTHTLRVTYSYACS